VSVRRPTAFFIALLLAALSLGSSWSHVLQIRGKAPWPGPFWQQAMATLYRDYAIIGAAIDVAAILAAWTLAYVLRGAPTPFRRAFAGAILLSAGLGTWFAFVAPINAVFANWPAGGLPADWTVYRDRWEFWHAVIAGLKGLALSALIIAALSRDRGAETA
jgi:hypothetical protein